MAGNEHTTDSSSVIQQPVGKVFIVYGTVKAVSSDGTTRALAPNSPIYAQDRILTESDGRVSIVFNDPVNPQLNLGRMSAIIIDEDVYNTEAADISDVAGEVKEIQETLLSEDFDPTTELEAPAAGDVGSASDGGGHPIVSFEATNEEVVPVSGAETTGVTRDSLEPIEGITEPQLTRIVTQSPPIGAPDFAEIEESAESPITGNLLDNDFSVLRPLSIVSIEIDGSSFVIPKNGSITQTTDLGGQITIYSNGTYEYSAPAVMHDYNDDGVTDPPVQESISYSIANEAGQTGSSVLTINITDTIPIANDDITDQEDENAPITYNVITNDTLGADDVILTDATVNTGAGTVNFSSDGEVTYDPIDGEEGTVIIDYTITDADGDTSQATLTINLDEDSTPTIEPESGTVYEAALSPDGSEVIPPGGSVTATGTLDIATGNDSIDEVRIGGETGVLVPVGGSTGVIAGSEGGQLVVTEYAGAYTWTYTQTNNTGHDQPINNTTVLDSFDLWVKDSDGDPASNTLEITIVDDVPTATADTDNVTEGGSTSGNVLIDGVDDVFGADGAEAAGGVVGVAFSSDTSAPVSGNLGGLGIAGDHGTLTLNADGSYTYVSDADDIDANATDTFVYTIEDGDGDLSTTILTIDVNDVTLFPDNDTIEVDEAALDNVGSTPASGAETDGGTLTVTDAVSYEFAAGTDGNGTYGTLTLNPNGSYSYTLDTPFDTTPDANDGTNVETGKEVFNYTATDADGNTVDGTITVDIKDDVPTIETIGDLHFVSEFAGYDNAVGTYELDANGNPINAKIIIESTNDLVGGNMGTNEQLLGNHNVETKLFIIADGGNISDLGSATLDFDLNGKLLINNILTPNDVFYMDSALNADSGEHFKDENGNFINSVPPEGGEIHIEDLPLSRSDADYNDVVLRFEKLQATVDEAKLDGGTNYDPETTPTVDGNLFTGAGAGFLAISIGADFNGSSLTVTSGGNEDTVDFDGDPKNGITVASAVGDLTVRGDGSWSYILRTNTLAHQDTDPGGVDVISDGDSDRGVDDQVQDTFDFLVTDGDGDTASTQFIVNINDDGPVAGDPQDAILAHEILNTVSGDLNIDFGADGASTTVNSIQLSGKTSVAGSGDPTLYVTDNAGNILTSGGSNLVYHKDGNGGLIAKTVDTDVEVFSVTVVPNTEPSYTVTLHSTIDGCEQSDGSIENIDLTTGGVVDPVDTNNLIFGSGDIQIHIRGVDAYGNSGKVNSFTSNVFGDGLGIAPISETGNTNNWIDNPTQQDSPQDDPDSEKLYMEFDDNLISADITVSFLDDQETATWTVYNTDGTTNSGSTQGIFRSDSTTFTVNGGTDPSTGQPVEFDTIMLQAGDGTDYHVLEITTYSLPTPGEDINLTYDLQITDGDGDMATSSFDVTFDADGNITGTDANEVISGSSTANTIAGGGGEDVIFGGSGNDTIFAQDGEPDIITGGPGDDTIMMDMSLDTLIDDPDSIA